MSSILALGLPILGAVSVGVCFGQRIAIDPNNQMTVYGGGTAAEMGISIYGDIVAWRDVRNGSNDIYAYNLATGVEFPAATTAASEWWPRVGPNYILYLVDTEQPGTRDVYRYDLDTGVTTPNVIVGIEAYGNPDNNCISYIQNETVLKLYDMDANSTRTIKSGPGNMGGGGPWGWWRSGEGKRSCQPSAFSQEMIRLGTGGLG